MAREPLSGHVNRGLAAAREGDADLQGGETFSGGVRDLAAEALRHQAPRGLPNGHGGRAGGGRVGILIQLLRVLSCSGMLLSTGCCVGDGCS